MKQTTWKGEEVWIIGGGSSIPIQFGVPESIIKGVKAGELPPAAYSPYMKSIHNKKVIGVNAAYKIGDWMNIVFFSDERFISHNREGLMTYPGELYSCNTNYSPENKTISRVTYIPKTPTKKYGLSENNKSICWNDNSGAAAINLAINLGAEKIILLGFDMKNIQGSHFHNEYPWQKGKNPPYIKHLKGFENIALEAKKRGVEILNCSSESEITQFKKVTVKEALKRIKVLKEKESPVQAKKSLKIGVVLPTCSPERHLFVKFAEKRISEQTRKVDYLCKVDFPNVDGKFDLVSRYQKGIKECFAKGCSFIVFWEDDDFYPKTYIAEMEQAWKANGEPVLMGCNTTRYYHIFSRGYCSMAPKSHSSAHCTAVGLGVNYKVGVDTNPFYDIALWRANKGVLVGIDNPPVSIKHNLGLSGGKGHVGLGYRAYDSEDFQILKRWVDEEAFNLYMAMEPASMNQQEWNVLYSKLRIPIQSINTHIEQRTKKNKIAIVSAVWQRPLLTEFIFQYYQKMIKQLSKIIEIKMFVAGSEGLTSKKLARKYDVGYVEIPNEPLSEKLDAPLKLAKEWGADGCICIGSDDLFNPSLIRFYDLKLKGGVTSPMGFKDIYFFINNSVHYLEGYKGAREGESIGAGRFFPKETLDKLGWSLWGGNNASKGMDKYLSKRLKNLSISIQAFPLSEANGYMMGIYAKTHITNHTEEQYPLKPINLSLIYGMDEKVFSNIIKKEIA